MQYMCSILVILLFGGFTNGYGGLQSKCPTAPKAPENCEEKTEIYTRGCLTGYECKSWKRGIRDVCAGAPTCPPPPSSECSTVTHYKYVNGVRCAWGCKHWCCSDVDTLKESCPTASPDNPYCIHTSIVHYTINGHRCPVYCSCVPDCRVLTC
ncbi:uncharacterized protein LOC111127068 [Crassostrea virginica]